MALTTVQSGMIASGIPTFSYYQSVAQAVTSSPTKITFTSSEWDTTGGMFSSSRFTPTVAGYYQINACVAVQTTATSLHIGVYKNGTLYKWSGQQSNSTRYAENTSVLVYCNGSTDYIEIYATFNDSQNTQAFQTSCYFQGCLLRSAN